MLKWISSYPYPLVIIAITNQDNTKVWYNCAGNEKVSLFCTLHSHIRLAEHCGNDYFLLRGREEDKLLLNHHMTQPASSEFICKTLSPCILTRKKNYHLINKLNSVRYSDQ